MVGRTTLTTVGYGDIVSITVGSKLFTTFVVFIGMVWLLYQLFIKSAFLKHLVKTID